MVPLPLGALLLGVATAQSLPPNLVMNGDARGGASGWEASRGTRKTIDLPKDAHIEECQGAPCFVLRNGASWVQRVFLHEDHAGKFILIIGRGSSERVHADDNITGLPYLWAQLWSDVPLGKDSFLQGMRLDTRTPNAWGTIHGIFPMLKGIRSITLKLGQAERKGTPQNGSAARFRDVEMRLFDSHAEAEAYVTAYNTLHDPGGQPRNRRPE